MDLFSNTPFLGLSQLAEILTREERAHLLFHYGDLATQQHKITNELFRFRLEQPSLEGTVV